ncbi:hypothetical protein [uncultured Nostoc sp.]
MLIVNSESLNGNLEVRSLFLANHRGAEDTEEGEKILHGGVLQAIAFFN